MSTDASVSIANFADHFDCELEKIDTLRVWFRGEIDHSGSSRVYRKTLYSTILDTLSRAAFPRTCSHRKRVLSFIDNYTGWDYRNRVSLPQLYLYMQEIAVCEGDLRGEVEKQLLSWSQGTIIHPDKDPERDDIVRLATTTDERKAIEETRYAARFYAYRNTLVHEFREPGYGIEHEDDASTPYYHSMTSYDQNRMETSWELVFPCGLFRDLCRNGLRALVKELTDADRGPHASFEFGTLWRQR